MADKTLDYSVKLLETIAKLKDKETGCDVELVSSVCAGFLKNISADWGFYLNNNWLYHWLGSDRFEMLKISVANILRNMYWIKTCTFANKKEWLMPSL